MDRSRSPRRRKLALAVAAATAASLGVGKFAHAQVATIGKGHQILVNNGLQIWGCDTGASSFTYSSLTNANMNGVMWSFGTANAGALSAGQKWGKWVDANGTPATALTATENAHYADLVALQVGDEQQSDIENPNGATKAWFDAAHNANLYTDKLLYTNSFFINNISAYINFVGNANPDAISFDSYPFGNPGGFSPYNWLGKAQIFRRVALGNYIGAHGFAPRPYGLYVQTYTGSDATRVAGDLDMRWQQFTAWTMGYTFVDAFTVGGGTTLFTGGAMNQQNQPRYDQFKETARQGRTLGPALTRLISYGYGPSFVAGKDPTGATNAAPNDWPTFNRANAPTNQQFLTGISAQNLGTKNGGQPGDVYVGFFNPLHASFGDPAGTAYFMVTNALGAYLQDTSLTPADCVQRLTMDFDMGWTTVNSLQRLNRNTGVVETIPLALVSGTQFRLSNYDLEGGTGDLFKYNDGSPFVGVQLAHSGTVYWDPDGNAANNNASTGGGTGGSGTWDSFSSRWYDGATDAAYTIKRNPVFWGPGGNITVVGAPPVDSMTFKSNYTLSGSSIALVRPSVSVDAGVTATINSTLSGGIGITKSGPGTLALSGSNNFSGGVSINQGVVRINSDAALGAAPAALATNIALNGGTLQFGANLDIGNTRGLGIGPLGGTIDTNGFSTINGYNATAGGFRGPGDLVKEGTGTFFAAATTGGANTTWTGRLIIREGTWKIVASDGLPYNVPHADGLKADQVTLDGGTWQMGNTINVTNGRRGITVTSNGGTIDTQGFNFTWAGPMAGSSTTAVLNKIGAGTLRFTGANSASTYKGVVNVNGGVLQLDNGNTMGDLASLDVNAAGLTINGDETIGSLAGAAAGSATLAGGITLTAGGNDATTNFAGVISGAGNLAKAGAGTMTLSGPNAYTGTTTVSAGTLALAASLTSSSSLTVATGATARLNNGHDKVLATNTISTSGTGKLDITDNSVVVKSSSLAAVKSLIASGLNGGNWQGAGITSTSAAANPLTAIGFASNGVLGRSSFAGVSGLDANDVLVKYTYYGDSDLDGVTTLDDFTLFLNGYQTAGTSWVQGDYDYSGVTTLDDFTLFLAGYQQQGAPLSELDAMIDSVPMSAAERAAMLAAVAAVPEPGTGPLALIAVAVGSSVARRERRRPITRL
jgi:autotransporter-associated beta strand protein